MTKVFDLWNGRIYLLFYLFAVAIPWNPKSSHTWTWKRILASARATISNDVYRVAMCWKRECITTLSNERKLFANVAWAIWTMMAIVCRIAWAGVKMEIAQVSIRNRRSNEIRINFTLTLQRRTIAPVSKTTKRMTSIGNIAELNSPFHLRTYWIVECSQMRTKVHRLQKWRMFESERVSMSSGLWLGFQSERMHTTLYWRMPRTLRLYGPKSMWM